MRELECVAGLAICQYIAGRSGSTLVSTLTTMSDALQVTDSLAIPRTELVYRASRSGGAGGQHVNTSSTRIEVLWDFRRSAALDDRQKSRISARLGARIDSDGMLRVVAGNRRSQLQNRVAAEERLAELVAEALHVAKARKRTRPTRASKEKRLTSKKSGRKRRTTAATRVLTDGKAVSRPAAARRLL